MRTVMIEKTVYGFDELSDTAKETARDWWRACEAMEFSSLVDYSDFKECAERLGIEFRMRPGPAIYWSGYRRAPSIP